MRLQTSTWPEVETYLKHSDRNGTKLSLFSIDDQRQKEGGDGIICHAKYHPFIPWVSSPDTTQKAPFGTADSCRQNAATAK